MNVFYLDKDPVNAAQMVCDSHCVKMILETAQLLSTSIQVLTGRRISFLYKPTHINHPSAIWARSSRANYEWLLNHFKGLLEEYSIRYGKTHKCEEKLCYFESFLNIYKFNVDSFTTPPQCMPDQYKVKGDTVRAYRNYYIGEKSKFAKWRLGNIPNWFNYNQVYV